jgi:hypothetical protein
LHAEFDRLVAADEFEAALEVLAKIPPVSDEEWLRKFRDAPLDDEPTSPELLRKFETFEASRARALRRTAG